LIRENKTHQIYASMQMGQEKFGMQTFNQSLASLYLNGSITYETAINVTSKPEELTDIIQRKEGIKVTRRSFSPTQTRKKERGI
jgi:twitching motility protein PilT